MLVSVITGTYNRRNLLRRAILSVLNQTHKEIEYFVCDDGSTDGTDGVVKGFQDPRLHYINTGHKSYYTVNRNQGVKRAKGELIMFLDDDNWWEPNMVEEHVKVHENPDIAVTYSGRIIHQGDQISLSTFYRYDGTTDMLNGVIDVGDLCFKRKLFKGFTNEVDRIGYCSDMEAVDKIMDKNPHMKLVLIPKYLHHYTMSDTNMTSRKLKARSEGKYIEEKQWEMG